MRRIPAASLLAGLLALPGLQVISEDRSTPAGRTVEQWIADLGSPSFSARQRAGEKLWSLGRRAIPALQKAAVDPSPEVSRRAREVLDRFGWGIFPETPPAVIEQINAFRGSRAVDRPAAFEKLLRLGPAGREAARSILARGLPADVRDPLLGHLTRVLRHEVPLLLFAGQTDEALDWLALQAAGTTPAGAADYAAFHLLNGTLEPAIAQGEADRKSTRQHSANDLLLAHLYRANREWAKARAAAAEFPRQANGSSLVEMLWEEEGNWTQLLQNPPPGPLNLPDGFRLTLLRLCDRDKEFEAEVKRIRTSADHLSRREDLRDAAFALLLNHRAGDAVDLLKSRGHSLGLVSEVLIARLLYKQVIDFGRSGGAKGFLDPQEKLTLDLSRARVFMMTGRRTEAVRLFGEAAKGLHGLATESSDWDDINRARRALLRSELRVGLRDLACDHAGLFTPDVAANESETRQGETVFDLLFGNDSDLAETVYRTVRARLRKEESGGKTMNRVRELFDGTASNETVDDAVKSLVRQVADTVPQGPDNPFRKIRGTANERDREVDRHLAQAAILRAANRLGEAEKALSAAVTTAVLFDAEEDLWVGSSRARSWVYGTADPGRPWREHGDFLLDRGRFPEAAAVLEDGWKRYPDQPLLLFLSGQAISRAGNAAEGKRRIELSHWVALGNERIRGKFLEELVRRGEGTAAKRETELLLRACWCRDFYYGNVMNQAARAAALNEDWTTAERCIQRSLFVLLRNRGVHFLDTAAYLNVPHEMLVHRTRGLLAAGKIDEAMGLARACLEVMPGHIGLVSGMTPDLEKRGRKREADELYRRVREAYERILAEYPDSPFARNALAALGANCLRDLDDALDHSRRAVTSEPRSRPFRETLAEVHFRRGERDPALKILQELLKEDPRNRLYRRQLARYRSGALDSAVPLRKEE